MRPLSHCWLRWWLFYTLWPFSNRTALMLRKSNYSEFVANALGNGGRGFVFMTHFPFIFWFGIATRKDLNALVSCAINEIWLYYTTSLTERPVFAPGDSPPALCVLWRVTSPSTLIYSPGLMCCTQPLAPHFHAYFQHWGRSQREHDACYAPLLRRVWLSIWPVS